MPSASSITNVARSWGTPPPAAIVVPGTRVRGGRRASQEQVRPPLPLRNVTRTAATLGVAGRGQIRSSGHAARVDPAHTERLAEDRARTVEQIRSLRATFDDIVAATEDVSTDDEHDPEGHTIAWERQQTAALLDAATAHLGDLDLAIRRVEGGDYGRCETCGAPIPDERLEALPTTRTCVACAP